jgi:beta-glucosidase
MVLGLFLAGCTDPDSGLDPEEILYAFPAEFRWGAAGAAHQVEGGNTKNQWYQFETLPEFADKITEPSGEAVRGYELYATDVRLAADLGLDLYRISLEWSRVEPARDVSDETEWQHYADVLDAIVAAGMEPMVTLHHFTEPTWTHDLSDPDCAAGPSDANLCGWTNPEMAEEFAEFAGEAARRLGDRVDEWTTFNEPMGYVASGWIGGAFPPGKENFSADGIIAEVLPVVEGMLDANARAYAAVKAADAIDATGDGVTARVGFTNAMNWIEPLDPDNEADVAAAERFQSVYGYTWPDATLRGLVDADLDGNPTDARPQYAGTCDLLGYQYYNRIKIKAVPGMPPFDALPCDPLLLGALGLDLDAVGCPEIPAEDITQMGYEHYPPGLRLLGEALAERYLGVPLRITENGIATTTGQRRAESIERHLREVSTMLDAGVPVDGYVHWSLTDNFEWAEGFRPRFGLYRVDYEFYERSATLGAEVYADIVAHDGIRRALVDAYDGEHLTAGE